MLKDGKYFNPLKNDGIQVSVQVTVIQFVRLGIEPHLGLMTKSY
jgi:hypothetical protein